jgi:hypothetical protein
MTALSQFDVLCGRSSESYAHTGNTRFRDIVQQRREEYRSATRRSDKNLITKQVIQFVQGPGGRFLRFDAHVGWTPLSDEDMYEKVSHALRGSMGSSASKAQGKAHPQARKPTKGRGAARRKAPPPTSGAESSQPTGVVEEQAFREVAAAQQSFFQALLQQQQQQQQQQLGGGTRCTERKSKALTRSKSLPAGDLDRRRQDPNSITKQNVCSVIDQSDVDFDLLGYESSGDESLAK